MIRDEVADLVACHPLGRSAPDPRQKEGRRVARRPVATQLDAALRAASADTSEPNHLTAMVRPTTRMKSKTNRMCFWSVMLYCFSDVRLNRSSLR
jgi:hypothetical protein